MSTKPPSNSIAGLARWIPAFGWLRSYQPSWLRGDVVAAYLLPAGLFFALPTRIYTSRLAAKRT